MEKILEILDNMVLDENKIEYLKQITTSKNETNKIIINPDDLYIICNQIIFDCNRNEILKLIKNVFDIHKVDETILYKILKLYIFDFERNIAFRILRPFLIQEQINQLEAFEKLYIYSNEKNRFLSLIFNKEHENIDDPQKTKSRCAT